MSNFSFDSVETTLRNLKEIVDRNHAQSAEAGQLVAEMEVLLGDIKTKARERSVFSKLVENAPINSINMTSATVVV